MKNYDLHNERELLELIAQGSEQAFATLLDKYQARVFAHALSYIKYYDETTEVVQDIFVRIWTQRERLLQVNDFPAYLFIISRNYLVSAIRKRVSERLATENEDHSLEMIRPDTHLEVKELERCIAEGVKKLPAQQRMVYQLSRREQLTQEQIALKMNISKRTVKFHMAAALNFLRSHLRNMNYPLLLILFTKKL